MKILPIALLAVVGISLLAPREGPARGAADHGAAADNGVDVVAADRERIGRHLEEVERHLRSVDVSHLSADQRTRRAEALDHLREYRLRGEFPHNHSFEQRTPFFVDHRGVQCAMAYLIARSGGQDLVARVKASANNAYVRDLASDPELGAWLERNGMTAAEAALVQPTYGRGPEPERSFANDVLEHYPTIGTVTLAADALALYLVTRADRSGVVGGITGTVAGLIGTTLGGVALASGAQDGRAVLAAGNVAAGVLTAGFSLRSLLGGDAESPGTPAIGASSLEVRPVFRRLGAPPMLALALRF